MEFFFEDLEAPPRAVLWVEFAFVVIGRDFAFALFVYLYLADNLPGFAFKLFMGDDPADQYRQGPPPYSQPVRRVGTLKNSVPCLP